MSDSRLQGVSLTGSESAGAAVASLSGQHLKCNVLEFGGDDRYIVLEDADLGRAIRLDVQGRMVDAEHSCVASKRFIVVQSVS